MKKKLGQRIQRALLPAVARLLYVKSEIGTATEEIDNRKDVLHALQDVGDRINQAIYRLQDDLREYPAPDAVCSAERKA